MNLVIFNGRLSREPEIKTVGNDKQVCEFGIVVDSGFGANKKAAFIDCVIWGASATFVSTYFGKGDGINIQGELTQDTWDDKNGGGKRSKHKVLVNRASFPIGKKGGGTQEESSAVKTNTNFKGQEDAAELPF